MLQRPLSCWQAFCIKLDFVVAIGSGILMARTFATSFGNAGNPFQ
jgi:hypothetical protein